MEESEKQVSVERVPLECKVSHRKANTGIGEKLIALREKYIANGGKLFSADEINEEAHKNRGG